MGFGMVFESETSFSVVEFFPSKSCICLVSKWSSNYAPDIHEPRQKKTDWLGYIGDEILPSYMGLFNKP